MWTLLVSICYKSGTSGVQKKEGDDNTDGSRGGSISSMYHRDGACAAYHVPIDATSRTIRAPTADQGLKFGPWCSCVQVLSTQMVLE